MRGAQYLLLAKNQSVGTIKFCSWGEVGLCFWGFSVSLARAKQSARFPIADNKTGTLMERLIEKVSRVVNSCVTPQQLEVAENFAERAKTKMNRDEWLDIASVINTKANKILFCSVEDLAILGKVWSRL